MLKNITKQKNYFVTVKKKQTQFIILTTIVILISLSVIVPENDKKKFQ